MTKEEIAAEMERLSRLLAARDGKPGFKHNCKAIQARMDDLRTLKPE